MIHASTQLNRCVCINIDSAAGAAHSDVAFEQSEKRLSWSRGGSSGSDMRSSLPGPGPASYSERSVGEEIL